MIYEPSDDTYLLIDSLPKNFAGMNVLEVGTGSGIIAEEMVKRGASWVLATDLDLEAALSAKSRGLEVIVSDLFSAFNHKALFDIIIFNPPYLPSDFWSDSMAWTGGSGGWELSYKFIMHAKDHLAPKGKIFIVLSSLTCDRVLRACADLGLSRYEVAFKEFFFEKLCVYEISRIDSKQE